MKPLRIRDSRRIIYNERHWRLLRDLRIRASRLMESLEGEGVRTLLVGSVARGDVRATSDIDVVIPSYTPTFLVENALIESGFGIARKVVVQATPLHAIKASIYLDDRTLVTIPLSKLSPLEQEFYSFAGSIGLEGIREQRRVPGVNKRLLLVLPVDEGHIEFSIVGREPEVARILGISLDTVLERERMLLRRDEVGRTGTYLKLQLPPEENIEDLLRRHSERNPFLRKKLRGILL